MGIPLFSLCSLLAILLELTVASNNDWSGCGKLNLDQVYNETDSAALDEFPWFGRIFYASRDSQPDAFDGAIFRCVSILISERHLLAAAHCFTHDRALYIALGDTGEGERNYAISDIAMHPAYNARRLEHDIAVIQLKKKVVFSAFIQPICLLPPNAYTDELLGQYLTHGGYSYVNQDPGSLRKTKKVAHVMPHDRCMAIAQTISVDGYICASSDATFRPLSGSALMGVQVEDSVVRNYYLIGIAAAGQNLIEGTSLEMFVKVASHLNWINSNIHTKRGSADNRYPFLK